MAPENLFFSLSAISVILARGIIVEIIRFFYDRPRPFEALGIEPLILNNGAPSSPSGHAAFFFALALAVFFTNKKWGYWFFAGALLIGIARIFIGIHWPLDILAGAAVGLISAFLIKKILSSPEITSLETEKNKPRSLKWLLRRSGLRAVRCGQAVAGTINAPPFCFFLASSRLSTGSPLLPHLPLGVFL